MSPSPRRTSRNTLRRLARQARPYWLHLLLLLALSLLSMPLALLNPVPLKLVVDCVLGGRALPAVFQSVLPAGTGPHDFAAVAAIAGLVILLASVKQLADMGYGLLRTWVGERIVLGFRAALFRHVQRLSLAYHDSKGAADTAYRIQYDAPAIQWVMVDGLIPLVTATFTLVAMVSVLTRIDWVLAVIALGIAPVLAITSRFYGRRLKNQWREAKDLESAANSVVQEVLGAVRVVKVFSAEDREQQRFEQRAGKTLREKLRVTFLASRFALTVGLTMALGTALVLFVGTRHVQAGQISLGDLVLVMGYLAQLYAPLELLTRSAGSLQGSLASADRAFALLDENLEVVEKPNARRLVRAQGHVVFENVAFAYRADRSALNGVSFEVAAGSRVGIAGQTGAGKSTLVSLLLRLYDPTAGRILLDGVDLRDYALRDLRNQFAMVLQDPVLFSASIGDNIAYAQPGATRDQIIAAARAANVHEFISHLTEGYDTQVGERGFQLSGGERQRISLARAFLKNAPILILDEPTSSVDVKTEAVIVEGIERLMENRTTFMIAHRLSTLERCNVRLELEGGRLVRAPVTPATLGHP